MALSSLAFEYSATEIFPTSLNSISQPYNAHDKVKVIVTGPLQGHRASVYDGDATGSKVYSQF